MVNFLFLSAINAGEKSSSDTMAKKPNLPVFIPNTGMPGLATKGKVSKRVPSPPRLIK